MAAEPDLPTAAGKAYTNLLAIWGGGGDDALKVALDGFWQGVLKEFGDTFPESQVNSHPVSNWLTLIAEVAERMPAAGISFSDFLTAVQYVYRCCWMTFQLETQGLITAAQARTGAGSILVQYNANF